jgi:hypothetical protein
VGDLPADLRALHVGDAEVDAGPDAGVDNLLDRLREARVAAGDADRVRDLDATSSVP